MKSDTITLGPDFIAEHLADCKAGETVTITATIESIDENGAKLNIESAEPQSDEEGPTDEPAATDETEAAPAPKRPAAVLAVLAKK